MAKMEGFSLLDEAMTSAEKTPGLVVVKTKKDTSDFVYINTDSAQILARLLVRGGSVIWQGVLDTKLPI